ncbi:MAG: hypothetical protein R3234_12115, partial [Thermoanaerobaculia bacterium]|nr:hypothetical protein [Thermoanaerobaculia bacterium]
DHPGTTGPLRSACAGEDHGDQVARGYVTVDVVDECSGLEAPDPVFTPANTAFPYFADGGGSGGIAIAENRLWGDVFYIDGADDAAQGGEAVHLWADPSRFSDTGIFTFYGRYSDWDGRDERVPVPNGWDSRYLNGGAITGGAEFIVWRDTRSDATARVSCGDRPSWWPLTTEFVSARDEQTNATDITASAAPQLELATQKVSIDELGSPYEFGFLSFGLDFSGATVAQAWVQTVLTAADRFSLGYNGSPFETLCGATP